LRLSHCSNPEVSFRIAKNGRPWGSRLQTPASFGFAKNGVVKEIEE
jgi:hypothetical protein